VSTETRRSRGRSVDLLPVTGGTLDARAGKAETPLDLTPDSTTDSLQLFLKGIGKVPLLTRAKQKMVESNLRLVVAYAIP
jgi:DNA-directed RNA polymerase sigma subunit (sigma70/sigma32)